MKDLEPGLTPSPHPLYFVGTSGWTYDHWAGCFYPQGLPRNRWFEYYAGVFSAVEINATYYRAFKDQTYLKWKERAPQGFGYVLKAPKTITHRKLLLDVGDEIRAFCRSCALLEDRLEMILLQVAPGTPYDLDRLENALLTFHDPRKVAVEFRRPEWWSPETLSLLQTLGATFCNVDSPRQELTDILTSERAYLRLHGRRRWYSDNYTDDELEGVARLARDLTSRGANRVYIFFNNDFECHAPANALTLMKLLERETQR